MVTYDKKTVGILALLISLTVVYVTAPYFGVRMRVDRDKATFYVKNDDNRWIVGGREYSFIFDGTSKMNRDLSEMKITTHIPVNSSKEYVKVTKETHYIRGPVIIETWSFDGNMTSVELFPVSHKIEVFNASGKFFRYEVRDLEYDGVTYKLEDDVRIMFGNSMKVHLDPDYRWAWVYKIGVVRAQYDIPTDYEVFTPRLYDPDVVVTINGTAVDRYAETGYIVDIACTPSPCTITSNNSILGTDFATDSFIWNYTMNGYNSLNNSNTTQVIQMATAGTVTVGFKFYGPFEQLLNASCNMSGASFGGNFPSAVNISINGTLMAEIGDLSNNINQFSDGATFKNVTFNTSSSNIEYIRIPQTAKIKDASLQFKGSNNTCDVGVDELIQSGFSSCDSCGNYAGGVDQDWGTYWQYCLYTGTSVIRQLYENFSVPNYTYAINFTAKWSGEAASSSNIEYSYRNDEGSGTNFVGCGGTGTGLDNPSTCTAQMENWEITGPNVSTRGYLTVYNPSCFRHWESKITHFNRTCNVTDPYVDVGDDGIKEWNFSGEYVYNGTREMTQNLTESIQLYLNNTDCADIYGFCEVPIKVVTTSPGVFEMLNLSVIYEAEPSPILFDLDLMNSFIRNSSGLWDMPVEISSGSSGSITLSAINFTYLGYGVVNITAYDGATKDESNLFIEYSNFSKTLPYSWTDSFAWYPAALNFTELMPWGQTKTVPIYNITWLNWNRPANLDIRINQTIDSINFTVATNNTYSDSYNLTDHFVRYYYNSSVGTTNDTFWLWAGGYNISSEDYRYFIRSIDMKSCCDKCLC